MLEYLFFGLILPILIWFVILKTNYFKQTILFLACYGIVSYFFNAFFQLELFIVFAASMMLFVLLKKFVKNDLEIVFDKKELFFVCLIVLVSLSGFSFERYWAQTNYEVVKRTFIDAKVPELHPSNQRTLTMDSKLLWFFGENVFDVFGFENKPALIFVNYFFFIGFLVLLFQWLSELKINPIFALPFLVFWQELIFVFGAFQEEALIAFFCLCMAYAIAKKDDFLAILAFSLGLMSKRIFIMAFPILFAYLALKNKRFTIILTILTLLVVFFVNGILVSLTSPFPEFRIEKTPIALIFVIINAIPALFYFYAKARTFTKQTLKEPMFLICAFAIIIFTIFELKYYISAWYLSRYLTLFSGVFVIAAANETQKKPILFFEFFFIWATSKMFLLSKEIMLY